MFLIFFFILGLIIGSFLNSVIFRLERGGPPASPKRLSFGRLGNIARERSRCPKCKHKLRVRELVPILSFMAQGGKCRKCHKQISWQYPLVELATGMLFVLVYLANADVLSNFQFSLLHQGFGGQAIFNLPAGEAGFQLLRDWIFIAFLVVIFVYDLKWKLILDKVTIPGMVLSFIFVLVSGGLSVWLSFLGAAAVAGGFFLLQFLFSGGRWIGGGDIRLGFLMGLMVGWPAILVALLGAYVVGALVSLVLIGTRAKQWSSEIPFGTFLSLGTVVALLYGQEIINWYTNFL